MRRTGCAPICATARAVTGLRTRLALAEIDPWVGDTTGAELHDEDNQLGAAVDSKRDYLSQLDWYRHWQRRQLNGSGA